MQREKKSDEKQPMKIQSTALKTRKTVEMDHVRRRLSSSSNNVSNMRLDGAMGIPLQVQVHHIRCTSYTFYFKNLLTISSIMKGGTFSPPAVIRISCNYEDNCFCLPIVYLVLRLRCYKWLTVLHKNGKIKSCGSVMFIPDSRF